MTIQNNYMNDTEYMQLALQCAQQAAAQKEVPVGAVLVSDDKVIAQGWNCPITQCDPTAHAEIVVLRKAATQIQNYRLLNTTLYVTLEPCLMCLGAMVHARIQRLVFGAYDPKSGAVSSVAHALDIPQLNHRVEYCGGVLAEPCGEVLREFFRERR